MPLPFSIISGGQTGADRAALDFAIKHGIPHGGWCPKGRLALDGPLNAEYQLKETPTDKYPERTEWNVRDSDATIVFTIEPKATGGSQKTISLAKKLKKPCLHIHKEILGAHMKILEFTEKHHVRRLNIAGSREPKDGGVYHWVTSVLEKMWMEMERRRMEGLRGRASQ